MCMSAYSTYHPRPVVQDEQPRPIGVALPPAELDTNLFGPKPMPPEWAAAAEDIADHHHGANEVVGVQGAVPTVTPLSAAGVAKPVPERLSVHSASVLLVATAAERIGVSARA